MTEIEREAIWMANVLIGILFIILHLVWLLDGGGGGGQFCSVH